MRRGYMMMMMTDRLSYLSTVRAVTRLLAVETSMRLLVSRQVGWRCVVFATLSTRVPLSSLSLSMWRRCRLLLITFTSFTWCWRRRRDVASSTAWTAVADKERVVRVADCHAVLERTGAPLTARRRWDATASTADLSCWLCSPDTSGSCSSWTVVNWSGGRCHRRWRRRRGRRRT